ncbi:hypothetical protein BOX15_Mlig003211g2 [Macrostomum lignano]|uniref:Uncharacterized protein n=1 Tax=Macrostomum lignano TaxID=282301 RepID=A0A267DVS1_9PLAT|nr:hypothetical protein BOX15_Mlig003211g2 [Macrostomum lignano]
MTGHADGCWGHGSWEGTDDNQHEQSNYKEEQLQQLQQQQQQPEEVSPRPPQRVYRQNRMGRLLTQSQQRLRSVQSRKRHSFSSDNDATEVGVDVCNGKRVRLTELHCHQHTTNSSPAVAMETENAKLKSS